MSDTRQRKVRCTIIGAGVSGILMAYKLRKHLPDYVDFRIYEKSPELGGTWYENRYPGCACDVPSHCYQYSFAPNPSWTKFYASSQEIKAYLESVVSHFKLGQYIQYNSKVLSATWSEESSTWKVEIENDTTVESELLVNAGGILNHPQMPNVEGLSSFAGPLLHTADWSDGHDLKDKRIAVIGSGASSVQLVPQLQPSAKNIQVFIRTPSWISPPPVKPPSGSLNHVYATHEKASYRNDDAAYLDVRKDYEANFNGMFRAFIKNTPEQDNLRTTFEDGMKQLIPDEELQKKLIPDFEAGCRRINPGENFLHALQKPNVQPIFDKIERVTPTGVVAGGQEYPADVLVAATGFNTTFKPRFPIIGRGRVNLQDLWSETPISYMSVAVSGFPNYLIFLGPNTPISNGSLMGALEATGDYFVRLIRKMVRQGAKSFEVQAAAQADFDNHTQKVMQDLVWTGTCRSWFKRGTNGRVTALWPGSGLHYMQSLAENRWEDFHWSYAQERFAYWGQGISWIEDPSLDPLGVDEREDMFTMNTIPRKGGDLSYYLWKSQPLPQALIKPEFAENQLRTESGNTEKSLGEDSKLFSGVTVSALDQDRVPIPV